MHKGHIIPRDKCSEKNKAGEGTKTRSLNEMRKQTSSFMGSSLPGGAKPEKKAREGDFTWCLGGTKRSTSRVP